MSYLTPLPHGIIDVGFYFDKRGCITISQDKISRKRRLLVYVYSERLAFVEKIKKIFGYGNLFKNKYGWVYRIDKPQDIKDFLLKINPYLRFKTNEVGFLLNNWVFVPSIDYNKDFNLDRFNELRGKKKKITNNLQTKEVENASIKKNTTR